MKKIFFSFFTAAGIVALLASCSAKPEKVTAMVAPGDKVAAVVVEFNKAVSAEQISADAFEVEGQEVVAAFVCDQDPTVCPEPKEKPECKKECDSTKAECTEAKPECKEGKPECDGKHECKGEKPECKAECDSTKAECPEAKPECKGKDGKFVVLVLKHECPEAPKAECDSTKACPEGKPECGKPEGCPEAKAECKAECDSTKACPEAKAECDSTKKCEKPEIAVPEVSVKQVKDIAAADGTTLKAWSKAFKATAAAPAFMGPKGPKGPKHACKGEKPECEKACEKAEPAK